MYWFMRPFTGLCGHVLVDEAMYWFMRPCTGFSGLVLVYPKARFPFFVFAHGERGYFLLFCLPLPIQLFEGALGLYFTYLPLAQGTLRLLYDGDDPPSFVAK